MSRSDTSSFMDKRDRLENSKPEIILRRSSNAQTNPILTKDTPPRPSSASPPSRRAVQVVYTRDGGEEYTRGEYLYENGKMHSVSPGFYSKIQGNEEEHHFTRFQPARSHLKDPSHAHTDMTMQARREVSREACFLRISREREREEQHSRSTSPIRHPPASNDPNKPSYARYSLSPLPMPRRPDTDATEATDMRRASPSPPGAPRRVVITSQARAAADSGTSPSLDARGDLTRFSARHQPSPTLDHPRNSSFSSTSTSTSAMDSRARASPRAVTVELPNRLNVNHSNSNAAATLSPPAQRRAITVVRPSSRAATPPANANTNSNTNVNTNANSRPATVPSSATSSASAATSSASAADMQSEAAKQRLHLPARSPFKSALKRTSPSGDALETPRKAVEGDVARGARAGSMLSPSLSSNLSLLFSPLRGMWSNEDGAPVDTPHRVIHTSRHKPDEAHASSDAVFDHGMSNGIAVIPLSPLPNPNAPHVPAPTVYANSPHMLLGGTEKVIRRRPGSDKEHRTDHAGKRNNSPGRVHWDTCIVRVRKIPTGDSDKAQEEKTKSLNVVKRSDAVKEQKTDKKKKESEDESWDSDDQVLPGEMRMYEGDLRYQTIDAVYSDDEEDAGLQSGLFGVVLADEDDSASYPSVDVSSHERKNKNNVNNASSPLVKRAFHACVCHLPLQTLVYAHPRYMTGLQPFANLLDELNIGSVLALANWKWYQLAKSLVEAAEREQECEGRGQVYWRREDKQLKDQLDDACARLSFTEIIAKDCTVFADLPGRIAGLIERELGHTSIAELASDPMFENAEVVVGEWRKGAHRVIYTHNSGGVGDDDGERPLKKRKT